MHANNGDSVTRNEPSQQPLPAGEPVLVEAAPERGFNYPYYLTRPKERDERRPLLVEPHNIGEPTDEFQRHRELAKRRAADQTGQEIAAALGAPFLVPVFPRPLSDPVDLTHCVPMLDAETMQLSGGPLERVDQQLLAMVDDARDRLDAHGYSVGEQFMLNGFSATGNFVNRFAALHPDRVQSVSAGGINGLAILPEQSEEVRVMGERPLRYPVGVANVEALTGDPFDEEAFREVYQFIYIGEEDDNDSLLYPDAWTDPERRGVAVLTYGEDIHDQRFPRCAASYREAGANAVFRVYEAVGHEPGPACSDIVEFHERSLAGEDIEALRRDLGGNVH